MDHQRASLLRQRILEQVGLLGRLAQAASERSALLAASLYERRRRCGKPRCRCARGQLHRNPTLAVMGPAGCRRAVSVAEADFEKISSLTTSHRRFRQTRAEMVRAFGALLETFDALGRLRRVEAEKLVAPARFG